MKKYLKLLKRSKLFYGITEEEIASMLECLSATSQCYQKGEYVFRRGERISAVAMLLEGGVHIQKEDYWGNLSILNKISEGEIFGEVYAALGGEEILNNAVAVKPSVVLFLDMNRILTMCPSSCRFHGQLIRNLLSVIASKNKMLTQKLEHMSRRTTREKLLSYLSEQSLRAGCASFDIPFNRQQLADFLSVDRSAMSGELCKMRDEGILSFEKNHFILKGNS
ncbi:MAG: Crp/Fnr family transcriptional regulator [Hominisplanchenecus sp.]|nr:Crp/Fnr family transcriptional regulator [Lachnospiraceae bacterium]MDY2819958.1 Crp/Fnr family transcriptional regulator [Hominisplanchenecus sp.]